MKVQQKMSGSERLGMFGLSVLLLVIAFGVGGAGFEGAGLIAFACGLMGVTGMIGSIFIGRQNL